MSVIDKTLSVQLSDNSVCDYQISFQDSGDSTISMTLDDGTKQFFEGDDLFKSLQLIRAFFEEKGAKVLCNGARVDVHPSGMSRGMGRGRKAYVVKLGKQARRTDLVDIFDYADPDQIGSIKNQSQYYKQWMDSLG